MAPDLALTNADLHCRHLIQRHGAGRISVCCTDACVAKHVSDETGTGFVHTAPSHGEDDYEVWMSAACQASGSHPSIFQSRTPSMSSGAIRMSAPVLRGWRSSTIEGKKRGQDGPANKAVMDKLIEAGALLARGRDHAARCALVALEGAGYSPRNAAMVHRDGPAVDRISKVRKARRFASCRLAAIDATTFTPERGRERHPRSMVAGAAGLADLSPARVGRAADAVC